VEVSVEVLVEVWMVVAAEALAEVPTEGLAAEEGLAAVAEELPAEEGLAAVAEGLVAVTAEELTAGDQERVAKSVGPLLLLRP